MRLAIRRIVAKTALFYGVHSNRPSCVATGVRIKKHNNPTAVRGLDNIDATMAVSAGVGVLLAVLPGRN